jgi:hypothetical protein
MSEDISTCLSIAGITLSFADFDILAIPGFETSMLYKGEATLYEVEKQWFSFRIATIDHVENTINLDDYFTMEDSAYLYTFTVNRLPIPDLTGFSKLHADFLSKVPL